MASPAVIDHLVIRAPSLAAGAAYAEDSIGVSLGAGGAHAAMGTHNLLAGLGGPYLEVIAVDPSLPSPGRPRWFDLDHPPADPHLAAWVVRVDTLPSEQQLGPGVSLARGDLSWQITVRDDGSIPFDGVGPMAIAWQTTPPELAPSGARLMCLIVGLPDPGDLADLLERIDLAAPVSVQESASPRLLAVFDTPAGHRVLSSDGSGLDVVTERQAAIDLFHRTWRYLDLTERAPAHDAAMVASAEASLALWRRAGAPTQWAIGEWQCSRVQAVLGHGETALLHAERCRDIAEADRVDDFVPASAHEALARAYAVLGDFDSARDERNIAYRMALELDDEDRDVIEHDLGTIAIPPA
ncbi:MAG: hypothetical protein FJW85_10255 [Actinobacteria bacterium]|nr:hypothetical protein [Actinomycetota bacterium]